MSCRRAGHLFGRRAVRPTMLVALLAAVPAAHGSDPAVDFRRVIRHHLARYPAMEIADLYKLAHQAALGSGHAVTDLAAARTWLEREIARLEVVEGEPLFEPLSPEGELVRVNLRPYLAGGGELQRLAGAFVETARLFEGSRSRLRSYWSTIEAMAREGDLPVAVPDLERFIRDAESGGFPAVHHSAAYRERYRPAYRTVLRSLLELEDEGSPPPEPPTGVDQGPHRGAASRAAPHPPSGVG